MLQFSIARLPRIEFGRGSISRLPQLARLYGQRILLVTGAKSLRNSPYWQPLSKAFAGLHIDILQCSIDSEPSPQLVDQIVNEYANSDIDAVVAIGGGSALDAAKAIAGLLKVNRSVMDYLEGVGPELAYEGPAVPFIAVPTTAGTGSEATKNAVLSVQGQHGFKKSFRHDKLVAEYALVDPQLLETCPKTVIAANGMDALTQLIESVVSLKSNELTDALAISGLRAVRDGLLDWHQNGGEAHVAQDKMAYAALISGITLAQVGLGSVHGLASPLGAFYPIPHGVVCGTLVASATKTNIESMLSREPQNPALEKYAKIGQVLCEKKFYQPEQAWQALIQLLERWTQQMNLPLLSHYGLSEESLDHVVANCRGSSMKTNPVVLSDEELKDVLLQRL
ncbi:MAG: alcohol dehydrogenase [Gammaproteobacteria bacterium SG8_11]|nr:MAG: alcohol dehydrogenase [Gammaproteobacteria bacterium SG8_11]